VADSSVLLMRSEHWQTNYFKKTVISTQHNILLSTSYDRPKMMEKVMPLLSSITCPCFTTVLSYAPTHLIKPPTKFLKNQH